MRLQQKIEWRLRLLARGVYLWREVDWLGLLREVFSPHGPGPYPPPPLLEQHGAFGLYQVGQHRIFFPLSFDPSFLTIVYKEIFVRRVYEYGGCRIRQGDWVVDAGACEGLFSLYALQKGANVLAFEPIPQLAQALEKTLAEFIISGRARVFPLALGKEKKKITLYLDSQNIWGSTTCEEVMATRCSTSVARPIQLWATSLDSLFHEGSLREISFIKADVEGAERDLLLGAQDVIRRHRPRLSICTYHLPDDWRIIRNLIKTIGVGYTIRFNGSLEHLYAW